MAFDHPPECHIHQSQNEVQVDGNEDDNRLSLLPDDILLNILERLPLHSAVHTSTLSRRWRRLPFLLSRLAIDIDEFRRRFGARAAVPSLMASYTEATKTLLAPTTERAIKLLRLAFYLCADLSCLRSIGHAVATAVAGSGGRPDDLAAVDLTLWTEVRSSRCKEHHAALYRRRFVSFLDACPGAFRCLTSLILRNLQFAEPDVPNILSSCHRLRELCLKYCGQLIIAESAGQSFVLKIDAPSSSQLVTLSLVECLLAWDRACTSKECGGLGIKRLDDQNHCLLMKWGSPPRYCSKKKFVCAPRLARLFVDTWLDEDSPPLRFGHVPQLRHVCLASALLSWQEPFALSACLANVRSLSVVDLNFKDEMIWIQPEDAKLLAPMFSNLKELHLKEIFAGCDLKWTLLYLEAAPSLNSFYVKISRHICERNKAEVVAEKTNLLCEARDFKHRNLNFVEIQGFQPEQALIRYTRLVMERAVNLRRIRLRGKDDECKRCDQVRRRTGTPVGSAWNDEEKNLVRAQIVHGLSSSSIELIME
ncbi:unnamed protein product [Urochloa decumbens]|uniref:F-box domain-containing protein n=1 Tax=Urochloa decumbens TaxID=240449 RepID=A0ABC8W9I2_9POAL